MFTNALSTPLQEISDPTLSENKVRIWIKRDDLLHPHISGNKWRKLKYNLIRAKEEGFDTILTFGGAYSNHIYATAAAANEFGFKSIGIIRGEEQLPLNPTLNFAIRQGMEIFYIERERYKLKNSEANLSELKERFQKFYLIPEGGTNDLAIRGTSETIQEIDIPYDYICCSVGTGGTISGLISAIKDPKKVLGFSALKGDFLKDEIPKIFSYYNLAVSTNWEMICNYHFNGYAKISPLLIDFIKNFYEKHHILLDPLYTGKMMFGLFDLINKSYFPTGSKIIALHTGGLQGWEGIKERYKNKPRFDFGFIDHVNQ